MYAEGHTDAMKTALHSAEAEGHAVIIGDRNTSVSINVSTSEIADLNVSDPGRVYAAALQSAEIKVHAADTYSNPTDTHNHSATHCSHSQTHSASTAHDKGRFESDGDSSIDVLTVLTQTVMPKGTEHGLLTHSHDT